MLPARYRDHNGPVITLSTAFAKKFNADCVAPALEELANMINNQSNAPKKILVYNPNKYTYNATDWEVPYTMALQKSKNSGGMMLQPYGSPPKDQLFGNNDPSNDKGKMQAAKEDGFAASLGMKVQHLPLAEWKGPSGWNPKFGQFTMLVGALAMLKCAGHRDPPDALARLFSGFWSFEPCWGNSEEKAITAFKAQGVPHLLEKVEV